MSFIECDTFVFEIKNMKVDMFNAIINYTNFCMAVYTGKVSIKKDSVILIHNPRNAKEVVLVKPLQIYTGDIRECFKRAKIILPQTDLNGTVECVKKATSSMSGIFLLARMVPLMTNASVTYNKGKTFKKGTYIYNIFTNVWLPVPPKIYDQWMKSYEKKPGDTFVKMPELYAQYNKK